MNWESQYQRLTKAKYIKREGSPGDYTYFYADGTSSVRWRDLHRLDRFGLYQQPDDHPVHDCQQVCHGQLPNNDANSVYIERLLPWRERCVDQQYDWTQRHD